jgi:hypothetical protein
MGKMYIKETIDANSEFALKELIDSNIEKKFRLEEIFSTERVTGKIDGINSKHIYHMEYKTLSDEFNGFNIVVELSVGFDMITIMSGIISPKRFDYDSIKIANMCNVLDVDNTSGSYCDYNINNTHYLGHITYIRCNGKTHSIQDMISNSIKSAIHVRSKYCIYCGYII